ncbi:MAG: helix-turn-helix domain-containing protein [Firmicutes bacterium]|nr:helix-turn-helix domain-containing protein [Bacillota bacterium]
MNIGDKIQKGLEEAIEFAKGNTKLKTTTRAIPDVRCFSATEVKELREHLGYTQFAFAKMLGVSNKTVEAWESGKNTPSGSSSRLLELWQNSPDMMIRAFA